MCQIPNIVLRKPSPYRETMGVDRPQIRSVRGCGLNGILNEVALKLPVVELCAAKLPGESHYI